MPPSVSFVIPTFRRPDALRTTLDAVLAVEYPSELCEVIVVDNAGDEATEAVVRSYCEVADTRALRGRRPAAARRARATTAPGSRAGELLILCDDDIVVEPSHVRTHLDTREQYGDCLAGGNWDFAPSTLAALQGDAVRPLPLALDRRFHGVPDGRQLDGDRWEVEALRRLQPGDLAAPVLGARRIRRGVSVRRVEDREFSMRAIRAGGRVIRDDGIRLLHNDQTITFEQFCLREERSAQTIAVLARKHPDAERSRTFTAVNGPITDGDRPVAIAKKLFKRLLATPPLISCCTDGARRREARAWRPDMGRLYSGVVGVHIFRGFRSAH